MQTQTFLKLAVGITAALTVAFAISIFADLGPHIVISIGGALALIFLAAGIFGFLGAPPKPANHDHRP